MNARTETTRVGRRPNAVGTSLAVGVATAVAGLLPSLVGAAAPPPSSTPAVASTLAAVTAAPPAPPPPSVVVAPTAPTLTPPRGIVGQRATVTVGITRTTSGEAPSSLTVTATVQREIVAASPGAGYTIRNTIVALDTQATGLDVSVFGFENVRGASFDQQASESGAITNVGGRGQAGLDLFDLSLASTNVDLPLAEMVAGQSWSGTVRAGNEAVAADVDYQAQLSAVGDTTFTADLSFAADVTEPLADGRQFSGTLSGTQAVTGRLDNRAAFDATLSQTIDGVAVDAAGTAMPWRWNDTVVVTTVG